MTAPSIMSGNTQPNNNLIAPSLSANQPNQFEMPPSNFQPPQQPLQPPPSLQNPLGKRFFSLNTYSRLSKVNPNRLCIHSPILEFSEALYLLLLPSGQWASDHPAWDQRASVLPDLASAECQWARLAPWDQDRWGATMVSHQTHLLRCLSSDFLQQLSLDKV